MTETSNLEREALVTMCMYARAASLARRWAINFEDMQQRPPMKTPSNDEPWVEFAVCAQKRHPEGGGLTMLRFAKGNCAFDGCSMQLAHFPPSMAQGKETA